MLIAILGCSSLISAQAIKPLKAVADDYIPLLNSIVFEAFTFDISSLSDRQYQITFRIHEYDHGKLMTDNYMNGPYE